MFTFAPVPKRKKTPIYLFAVTALAAVIGFGSTFAADITINTGAPIEFGQGVAQTVTCGGADVNITITPKSTFFNASGAGRYAMSSFEVSNIPAACDGVDFTFSFYGDSSVKLQPNQFLDFCGFPDFCVNGDPSQNINDITIHFDSLDPTNGTVGSGYLWENQWFGFPNDVNGHLIGERSGDSRTASSFEVSIFLDPNGDRGYVAPGISTTDLSSIAVQSSGKVRTYSVGDDGPAGGYIFYKDPVGFACGMTGENTCHYLEVTANTSLQAPWCEGFQTIANVTTGTIGFGYINSTVIPDLCGASSAAALALNYSVTNGSNTFADWYLPSSSELHALCQARPDLPNPFSSVGLLGINVWASNQSASQASTGHSAEEWFGSGGTCLTGETNMTGSFHYLPVRSF